MCNFSTLHVSIDRFGTWLGQRIAHTGGVAIT